MISQSGAMAVALMDWAVSHNLGFSKLVSMGNKADLDENDLPGNNQFSNNCIENNVADAIYAGVLLYRQLLPDVSIKDFMQNIETYYAGKFVVDNINKVVSFIKYNRFFYYAPVS